MANKKVNIQGYIDAIAEKFGIEKADTIVIGISNGNGECVTHLQGPEIQLAALVNEVMGQTVAKIPKAMQEVVMAEILSNSKATRVN